MTEPSLDTWITIKDNEKKYSMPYFSYRICCNHNVNGEISLLKSILKNTPKACIFDVGATGSCFPAEVDTDTTVHLFDPAFIPSGDEWKNKPEYKMYKRNVNYDGENIFVNKTIVDDDKFSISEYCSKNDIKHIDFLKIDTDGHDLAVLNGIGNVNVDMIQFEYDHFYRKKDININDMFNNLPDWHFFYILPTGLIEIKDMRTDYIYTNILATKKFPDKIIKDFVPIMKDSVIETRDVAEFVLDVFWEANIPTEQFKNLYCYSLNEPNKIDVKWNLKDALSRYSSLYDR